MTRSFSLTHPERDPHIGPNQRGADYWSLACDAYTDAHVIAHDMNECRATSRRLAERIENGRVWINNHAPTHPRYMHNRRRLDRMEWAMQEQAIRFKALQVQGWSKCCSCYAALAHLTPLERQAWWQEHGNDRGHCRQPIGIWRAAGYETRPPSGWPPDHEDWIWEGYSGWGLLPRRDDWLEDQR